MTIRIEFIGGPLDGWESDTGLEEAGSLPAMVVSGRSRALYLRSPLAGFGGRTVRYELATEANGHTIPDTIPTDDE